MTVRLRRGRTTATAALAALALAASGALAGCDVSAAGAGRPSGHSSTTTSTSSPAPQLAPETLTVGVVGSPGEVAQYRSMAQSFAPLTRQVTVKVESWPTDDAMFAAFRRGQPVPDVFLSNRRHLAYLTQHQLVQPVDQLLDERGFDLGDEYPRFSLTAYGVDNRLQCLPYAVQPAVIFYNKRLLRLRQIRSLPISPGQGWSFAQLVTAIRWVIQHHPGAAALHLDPSLAGLAPLIYSAGGALFDNPTTPTQLALSSETNVRTLAEAVRALRIPGATLTPAQLAVHSPLDWFMRGRLAMIEGTRSMVPDLRSVPHLDFDVMPMPTLGSAATAGTLTGMCISSRASDVDTAADFLVYANSPSALALVSYGGYVQPANQAVALSNAFQQPGTLPRHAAVFTFSVKSMVFPPVVEQSDALDARVAPMLEQLLAGTPADVRTEARRIDRASYRVIGPRLGPSATPSQPGG